MLCYKAYVFYHFLFFKTRSVVVCMEVVLENIRSMHNVGSIFRSSDGVGVEKIYLCGYTSAPVDVISGVVRPQIDKVALGATEFVTWEKAKQAWRLVEKLKQGGKQIVVLEQHPRSVPLNDVRLSEVEWNNTVLVVGHELHGVSKAVLKRSDMIVEIPMQGKKRSLNVSVAFGVAVYSLLFQKCP